MEEVWGTLHLDNCWDFKMAIWLFKWILAEFLHDTTHPWWGQKYQHFKSALVGKNFKNTAEIILGHVQLVNDIILENWEGVRHGQNTSFRWILVQLPLRDLFIFRMGYSIS